MEWTASRVATSQLSRAEAEVARLILAGASNAAIADARGRSVGTVVKQVATMFRKLGVGSRSELYAKLSGAGASEDVRWSR